MQELLSQLVPRRLACGRRRDVEGSFDDGGGGANDSDDSDCSPERSLSDNGISGGSHCDDDDFDRDGRSRGGDEGSDEAGGDSSAGTDEDSSGADDGECCSANGRSVEQAVELRIDKRDGLSYTKEEFEAYYHGLREWNSARQVPLGTRTIFV